MMMMMLFFFSMILILNLHLIMSTLKLSPLLMCLHHQGNIKYIFLYLSKDLLLLYLGMMDLIYLKKKSLKVERKRFMNHNKIYLVFVERNIEQT